MNFLNRMIARTGVRSENVSLIVDSLCSLFFRIIGASIGFVLSIVVGRQLGITEAGYYFFAFSLVTVLASVSRMGMEPAVLRFTSESFPENDWLRIRQVLSLSSLLCGLASIIVAVVFYLLSDFLAFKIFDQPSLGAVFRGMSPAIIGINVLTLFSNSLQGLRKIALSIFFLNISLSLALIVASIALRFSDAVSMSIAFSVSSFFACLFVYFFWINSIGLGGTKISLRELLLSSNPLWVVTVMTQITQYAGQLVAGAWVDSDQFAQLAVAQRTAMLTSFILTAVNYVVAPKFATLYKKKKLVELENVAKTSVRIMAAIAFPIAVLMLVFPSYIMSVFGEGFSDGKLFLQILVIGQLINVVAGSVGMLLVMSGHEKDFRNSVLFSGPIAIVLAFLLVPIFGATGSAVATAVAVAAQNLLCLYWVKRRLRITPW